MAIVRLQHVGTAVHDFGAAAEALARAGLPTRDFRNDQGRGFQHDARALLGNDCWLHVVHNWNPEARVHQFLRRRGPGLEHLALESDDIEADAARLRDLGVPIFEDRIFDANDGFEAFVYPDDAIGFTVELIQPHPTSWGYPESCRGRPVSDALGRVELTRIGAVVPDVESATRRFATLFDVPVREPSRISLGNVELHLEASSGEESGLRYLAIAAENRAPSPSEAELGFSLIIEPAARGKEIGR